LQLCSTFELLLAAFYKLPAL